MLFDLFVLLSQHGVFPMTGAPRLSGAGDTFLSSPPASLIPRFRRMQPSTPRFLFFQMEERNTNCQGKMTGQEKMTALVRKK